MWILLALCGRSPVLAAHVDTLLVPSRAMGRPMRVCVTLPDSYAQHPKSRFSGIYLLHGAGGNHTSYLKLLKDTGMLARLANAHSVLMVMPDADTLSYYINSPTKPTSQAEDFIIKELIPFIDAHYRTLGRRQGRAIVGLSMGGHGALYLASKHPRIFCAVAAISSAVDLNTRHWARLPAFCRMRDSTFSALMGPKSTADTAVPFPAYTVLARVPALKKANLALSIDCGTEDFLLGPNRALHQRLIAARVPHSYTEAPGKHNWDYWTLALPAQIAFVTGAMRRR